MLVLCTSALVLSLHTLSDVQQSQVQAPSSGAPSSVKSSILTTNQQGALGTREGIAQAGQVARSPSSPPSSNTAKAASYFPSDAEISNLVQPYISKRQAEGIVVGLLEPDGRRRILVFGKSGVGTRPLSARSVFEIGSITKTFTGTLLADMVLRGEVRLDDPVSKYLPSGVRIPSWNGRQITLLDLATHMSGLPRYPTGFVSADADNPFAGYKASDLYEFLGNYQLQREPGSKAEYSNVGVGLLGHALARAAKANSLETLLTRRVLRPLRLSSTALGRPEALRQWLTQGHDAKGRIPSPFDAGVLAGAGGLNSTAGDLLTYLDANLGAPRSKLEEAMQIAQRGHRPGPGPGIRMGLGWMSTVRNSRTLLGHNGGTAGYSTYIAIDPDHEAGVVVLANTGGFEYSDKIGRELLNPANRSVKSNDGQLPAKAAS